MVSIQAAGGLLKRSAIPVIGVFRMAGSQSAMAIGILSMRRGDAALRLALALGLVATISSVCQAQQATAPTQVVTSFDCSRAGAGQSVPALVCQTPELQTADLRQMQAYYTLRHAQPARQQELRNQFTSRIQALVRDCSTEQVRASGSQPTCVTQAFGNLGDFWIQQLQQTGNAAALEEARQPVEQFVGAQRALRERGFLPDSAVLDGVYGSGTRDAVARFQAERGISSNGFLTGATLAALGGSSGSRTSAPAAQASSPRGGTSSRGGPADQQPAQTAQLSSADQQNRLRSARQVAANLKGIADAAEQIVEILEQIGAISSIHDRRRVELRNDEQTLRTNIQEAKTALSRIASLRLLELRDAEEQIKNSIARMELAADRIQKAHSPPQIVQQERQQERAERDRVTARESYSRRPKTQLEQILNYTTTSNENGIIGDHLSEFWVSGHRGADKCILTFFRIDSSGVIELYDRMHAMVDPHNSSPRQIDIRKINERGFNVRMEFTNDFQPYFSVGDEQQRLFNRQRQQPVQERLHRAWRLAFQECPGVRTAF